MEKHDHIFLFTLVSPANQVSASDNICWHDWAWLETPQNASEDTRSHTLTLGTLEPYSTLANARYHPVHSLGGFSVHTKCLQQRLIRRRTAPIMTRIRFPVRRNPPPCVAIMPLC